MSLAVKLFFTALIVSLATWLSLSGASPIRPDLLWLVIAIAAGVVAVMWTFPKAGF